MPDIWSWDFWAGAIWGAATAAVFLDRWLIRPMGRFLGFEERPDDEGADPGVR